MIHLKDSLLFLKAQPDNSADILFCDPPYALGSEIIIKSDGKPDYKKAVDFMNKWKMPDGKFWEEFYKEAFRVLKFGGHCVMYGMDRQNFMFKYYGHLAGFTGKQSLYWYFISNFPKASDLSKMIDKNAKVERSVIGKKKFPDIRGDAFSVQNDKQDGKYKNIEVNITEANTPLAKKYSGYKYSVAPLKQVVEEIMVFQKPMKTGSVLHDTLAMEYGDESITCGALDIDGNRVEAKQGEYDIRHYINEDCFQNLKPKESKFQIKAQPSGRYPAQAFLTNTEDVLKDTAKVLQKCPYETEEYDLFNYCSKVSKKERNAGCEELEQKPSASSEFRPNHKEKAAHGEDGNPYGRWTPLKNNHPTLKPIQLNEKILRLFKTPNWQRILIPFAGSGSEIIGAYKAGFEDIEGCEINEEYIKIAEKRIGYWCR